MHDRIDLARGPINGNTTIIIELIEPTGGKPLIEITWPTTATVVAPSDYDTAAAAAMRILAAASTAIAGLKARKRL